MKSIKFHRPEFNPIYRDFMLVMFTGFLVSLIIVTLGVMLFRGV